MFRLASVRAWPSTDGAAIWTALALVVGLWWSLAQLDVLPFEWVMTAPLAILALAASMYLSFRSQ